MPDGAAYLLDWFYELHAGRQSTGYGPASLSNMEIEAWSRLSGRSLLPWEFHLIRQLDSVYLAAYGEAAERRAAHDRATNKTKR